MKILFTICGRAGSKGIKNKNIRDFCGKPLVYYTISAIDLYLKEHPEVEWDIVVNSDSQQLLDITQKNGMRNVAIIERKAELGGDSVGKIEVINDCKIQMEQRHDRKYDLVVDLDITSPLRTKKDVESVINLAITTEADVVTTVVLARRNPFFNQVMRTDHGVKKVNDSDYTARQQAPDVYDMNASIYAYKPSFLGQNKGVLDGYTEVVEMYDTGILDLDHENDFELMEVIAEYLFQKDTDFNEVYTNCCPNNVSNQ